MMLLLVLLLLADWLLLLVWLPLLVPLALATCSGLTPLEPSLGQVVKGLLVVLQGWLFGLALLVVCCCPLGNTSQSIGALTLKMCEENLELYARSCLLRLMQSPCLTHCL